MLIGVVLSQRSGNKFVQRLAQLGEVTGQLSHSQAEFSGKFQWHMGQADEDFRQIRIFADKVKRRGECINEVKMGNILTRVELQTHLNSVWLTTVSGSNCITMRVT